MAATASQAPRGVVFGEPWNMAMTPRYFGQNVTYYRVAAGLTMTAYRPLRAG